MQVSVIITFSNELVDKIIISIMENFPEASDGMTMRCAKWRYDDCEFTFMEFKDDGEEKRHELTIAQLREAFILMFTDKWPKGLLAPPVSTKWDDWDEWLCQSDAFSFDAFVQLACLGEVIYG